jgi:acyl dehydratase
MVATGRTNVPLDPQKLLALRPPPLDFAWSDRDCLLYAVATGFGQDPMDEAELPFVFERDLRVSPTFSTVLCWDDAWLHDSGIDSRHAVHGEELNIWHRPLPPAGRGRSTTRLTGLYDKGPGKGVLLEATQEITDAATGELICTSIHTSFARADGGCGGSTGEAPRPLPLPERTPDLVVERRTQQNQALLYRLCGDRNPLHADPVFAAAGGFARPILHGLCTYGFTARALLQGVAGYDPARLRRMQARFTAPVVPGDLLRTEIWAEDGAVRFRVVLPERGNLVALNNGRAEVA